MFNVQRLIPTIVLVLVQRLTICCRFMCEGGREVSRGGDGARLLVELGCDHVDHDNHDDPVGGSMKESLAIEKYTVLNMQDPDQYFLGILVRFPN